MKKYCKLLIKQIRMQKYDPRCDIVPWRTSDLMVLVYEIERLDRFLRDAYDFVKRGKACDIRGREVLLVDLRLALGDDENLP